MLMFIKLIIRRRRLMRISIPPLGEQLKIPVASTRATRLALSLETAVARAATEMAMEVGTGMASHHRIAVAQAKALEVILTRTMTVPVKEEAGKVTATIAAAARTTPITTTIRVGTSLKTIMLQRTTRPTP